MKPNLKQVGEAIDRFISQGVEAIARKTKFVQRKSELSGQSFLQTTVFGCIEKQQTSLNELAQVSADLGVKITAQGLDQRITDKAVAFLKQMFSRAIGQLRNQVPLPLEVLQQFNGIYLTDSSIIALPDNMAQDYQGCGGNGPQASLKVQLVFEFLLGNLTHIALRAGREPDQSYRDYINVLEKGSLSITDLGYFALDAFKAIMYERLAYILSRLNTQTGLLTPYGEAIDLLSLAQSRGCEAFEIDILMGKRRKHQLPCRLIVLPVPQQVADRRRYKAKEKARRQNKAIRKRTLTLMGWTFFVTNVPADMLSIEQIAALYAVRWQVELVFKLCKSHCGLNHIAGYRRERILVELYAKLIGVVLTHFLVAPLRMPYGTQANREISPVKVRKIFQRSVRNLNRYLGDWPKFQAELSEMLMHIQRFGFKEKRNKEPNVCHALAFVPVLCGIDTGSGNERS